MGDTKISWTNKTWNPLTGCSVVSPGCTNCYAMRLAGTRLKHHPSRKGLTKPSKAGPVWTGEVRFNEQWLDQPLRWRKPRMIFTCAHADLFHESVPFEVIDRIFAVMARAEHHTFQVLTKRSARMLKYVAGLHARMRHFDFHARLSFQKYPLPNVWLGVSVEDQQRANERIPDLLETPAAVRFVSVEPQLELVDLKYLCLVPQKAGSDRAGIHLNGLTGKHWESGVPFSDESGLDWVICGAESGPGRRPFNEDWARSLREQCDGTDTAFFFKQTIREGKKVELPELDGVVWDRLPMAIAA